MTLEPAPAHRVADDSGPSSPPLVSFVVVNWKNEEATRQCVASIVAQDAGVPIEVIVVDNESTPESRTDLGKIACITLLVNERNEGFTGGMNAGFAKASGEFLAAVNNDSVIATDWLRHGLREMRDPRVGIVGGIEYLWDADNPVLCESNTCYTYCHVDPIGGFTYRSTDPVVSSDVRALDGNNLLMRADVIAVLGGFAPRFFAYYEDVDLCARALSIGRKIRLSSTMRVWHRRNLSSDRIPYRRQYLAQRNHLMFVARHFPDRSWYRVVFRMSLQYLVFGVLGREAGYRTARGAERIGRARRRAHLASGAWGILHFRYLWHDRAHVGSLGQRSEHYLR